MDLMTQQWSADLLEMFHIKPEMLASIRSNAEEYGKISRGPLKGVPIAGDGLPCEPAPADSPSHIDKKFHLPRSRNPLEEDNFGIHHVFDS